jgi:hypothetical protein
MLAQLQASLGALLAAFRRLEMEEDMPVKLDHTILTARDKTESATFLAELLGLGTPVATGHFLAVALDNGLTLDFCSVEEGAIRPQHLAFEVSEAEFDSVLGRVKERNDLPVPRHPRAPEAGLGPTPYFAGLCTFVNIHHFAMDSVIWRRDNRRQGTSRKSETRVSARARFALRACRVRGNRAECH